MKRVIAITTFEAIFTILTFQLVSHVATDERVVTAEADSKRAFVAGSFIFLSFICPRPTFAVEAACIGNRSRVITHGTRLRETNAFFVVINYFTLAQVISLDFGEFFPFFRKKRIFALDL